MKKLKTLSKNKYVHALAAAVIAGVIYIILLSVCRIVPFGDDTRLMYDMKRQYADFYAYYKTLLNGINNIFYSSELSLGAGAMGFFTYYLTSPFLLLLFFFDNSRIPLAISFMVGLKLVCMAYVCDLFLQYYLKREDKESNSNITTVFALCYTFSSYMMSNSLNPMWLDVYMLMPLVILMLDRLLLDKKRIGYIISLALIIYCNYYIAFMVCIFIVMWSVYCFFGCGKEDRKKVAANLGRMIYCSLIAVALDAWCLIPTFIELFNSPKDITKLGMETTKGNLGITEVYSKIFALSYDYNQTMFGTPLLYAGVIIVILTILYFLNSKISIREKCCMAVMYIIFAVSYCIDIVNLCWHAGMEPSGYPYREAFMCIFLCIICSCRCINTYKEGISVGKVCVAAALVLAFLAYVSTRRFYFADTRFKVVNAALVAGYTLVLIIFSLGRLRDRLASVGMIILTVFTAAELTACAVFVYSIQGIMDTESRSKFAQMIVDTNEAVTTVKKDTGYYRVENITPREQNDGMMYDYHPITHYSSAGTLYTRYILTDMGFNDDELFTNYGNNNTCLSDMLLGVKYILSTGESHHREYPLISDGTVKVYENPYAMPVAMLSVANDGESTGTPFDEQQNQLETILGRECNIFVSAGVDTEIIKEDDMETGNFKVTAPIDGNIYFYIDGIEDYSQNMEIFYNGESRGTYGNAECLAVLNLGYYEKGETFDFTVKAYGSKIHEGKVYFMSEDMDELVKCFEESKPLNATLEEKSSSDMLLTLPEGYEQSGAKGVRLTLPYDSNWKVYSGSTQYEPSTCGDYFMYIPIEQFNEGQVELKYTPAGLYLGISMAILALFIIILIYIFDKKDTFYISLTMDGISEYTYGY